MTRIYISGPIAGSPSDNRTAFDPAAAALAGVGHLTINPFEVPVGVEHPTWADYLRADLLALIQAAEGVATLPGWPESRGASLEVHVAKALGIPVKPLDAWLTDGDAA